MLAPGTAALRRGALAVCVLRDIDLIPVSDGVELTGEVPVRVSWDECLLALRGADPEGAEGRRRLAVWLLGRRLLGQPGPSGLADRIRPVGLPVGHLLHPGPAWAWHTVLGGAVELGLGLVALDPARPADVLVIDPQLWATAHVDAGSHWPAACSYLTAMALLAAERRKRLPAAPLRPMGDCDVVTLLCSAVLRSALTGPSGDMVAAGVPMRDRGWTELRRIDPAFVVAAAAATDPLQRGFPRPLLITAEEVVMVGQGGRPADLALRDGTSDQPWQRPVRYR